jgi:hypothetical protein
MYYYFCGLELGCFVSRGLDRHSLDTPLEFIGFKFEVIWQHLYQRIILAFPFPRAFDFTFLNVMCIFLIPGMQSFDMFYRSDYFCLNFLLQLKVDEARERPHTHSTVYQEPLRIFHLFQSQENIRTATMCKRP